MDNTSFDQANQSQAHQLRTNQTQAPISPPIKVFKAMEMRFSPFHLEEVDQSLLMKRGIVHVRDHRECDLCVAKMIEPLKPFIKQYGSRKTYLIWNSEPRQEPHFTKQVSFRGVDVHIMNAYTGDIWVNNYGALNPRRWIDNHNPLGDQSDFSRPKQKKVAALLTYRNDQKSWSLRRDGVEIDLSYLRTQIALQGYQNGKVDIYGQKWPDGIAIEDSRYSSDWGDRKQDILKNYSFNLCFENTNLDYYCTEKIWDSIAAGCLPIYYGKGNKIYEDFPPRSFLDYAELGEPSDLFTYIDEMSFAEFKERMSLCLEVYHNAGSKGINNGVSVVKQIRIDKLVARIQTLMLCKPVLPTPDDSIASRLSRLKRFLMDRFS
jgi:hypothetical protein